jgi:folate-binding protein YgfZ
MSTPTVELSKRPAGMADELGVLAFRGADAARFLQGQVSADVEKLAPGQSTLAGLHNPHGRLVALLGIVRNSADELMAVLPRELATGVAQRLRKFVFRAKVTIEDVSTAFNVLGVESDAAPSAGLATIAWGSRRMLLVPASRVGDFAPADAGRVARWQRADVLEGLPQVYAATSEAFVAQMLNLDLLGAIAFDKGCYTGQEVIARAHYRGRVKRRLQRWHGTGNYVPRAGDAVRSNDGRALTVVRAAETDPRGWEILAVGTFVPAGTGERTTSAAPEGDATAIMVDGPLPLPYSLPE